MRHRSSWALLATLATVALLLGACRAAGGSILEISRVSGVASAGPTCPVVTNPPDPNCLDRGVAGAVLVIRDYAGSEVARVTTGADGTFATRLAPGAYRLVPQPVEGLMGTAPAVEFEVVAGQPTTGLRVSYDTGIR